MDDKELMELLISKGMSKSQVEGLKKNATAWESLRRTYAERVIELKITVPKGVDPVVSRDEFLRKFQERADTIGDHALLSDWLDIGGEVLLKLAEAAVAGAV